MHGKVWPSIFLRSDLAVNYSVRALRECLPDRADQVLENLAL